MCKMAEGYTRDLIFIIRTKNTEQDTSKAPLDARSANHAEATQCFPPPRSGQPLQLGGPDTESPPYSAQETQVDPLPSPFALLTPQKATWTRSTKRFEQRRFHLPAIAFISANWSNIFV